MPNDFPARKPLILCDVRNTLLDYNSIPNTALIEILNQAYDSGFEVRIVTSGADGNGRGWVEDMGHLRSDGDILNRQILLNAWGKARIAPTMPHTGVVLIIDDESQDYIKTVQEGNPGAQHLHPRDLEAIKALIATHTPAAATPPQGGINPAKGQLVP